jgi:hypothetical protein
MNTLIGKWIVLLNGGGLSAAATVMADAVTT